MSAGRKLATDKRGVALVEFALIAPALMVLLMGVFEMGYNFYMEAQLQGAVQKAARDAANQSAQGNTAQIDADVAAAVHAIAPDATLTFSRKAYSNFSDVYKPEDFTDINHDGVCDHGEPFEDANGNGVWDADRGTSSGGGARDAVLYVVTVTYPRAFGAAQLIGLSSNFTTETTTVLRNQPWDNQSVGTAVGNCP